MPEQVKIAVIGGGISGLCTAYYAAREWGKENVLVLEAGDRPGGTAWTERADGFQCEWGPNGFLDREPLTLEWVEDMGLGGQLIRANEAAAKRFILKNNRLFEIKPPPAFLLSNILSVPGRLRLLLEPFIAQKKDDSPESIWDFVARRIGSEAADTLVSPMVSGIFGGDAKQLSLAHCFPRMAAMEAEYGSLIKAMKAKAKEARAAGAKSGGPAGPGGTLTSFAKGMRLLVETAAKDQGSRLRLKSPVESIEKNEAGYLLHTAYGEKIQAEKVVVSTPAFAAADMLAEMDKTLANALGDIPYSGIAVLCVGYKREKIKRDLNGFGFLIPRTQGKRLLGCIWTSSLFSGRAPEGSVLLHCMFGGATDPEVVDLDDAALMHLFQGEIGELLGIQGEADYVQIFRHGRGIPQYTLGHGERLAAIEAGETRHPGLVFAGNAYRGVGVNDCVVSAHRAIKLLKAKH